MCSKTIRHNNDSSKNKDKIIFHRSNYITSFQIFIISSIIKEQHIMDHQTINVIIEGQKIAVPAKFAEVSEYMRGLQALGFEDEQDIQVDSVPKETFFEILNFYKLCNYQQVSLKTPIKSNELRDMMKEVYAQFIGKYSIESNQFKNLVRGCQFLGCKTLLRVCAARCACIIYFGDSKEQFEQKQKQLKIKVEVKFENNEKFKKLYPFMNN